MLYLPISKPITPLIDLPRARAAADARVDPLTFD